MKLIERRAFFVLKSEHIACVRAFEAKNSQSELHFVLIHHLTAADARRESAIYFCVKLARKQKESNKKQPLEAVFSIIACPSTTQWRRKAPFIDKGCPQGICFLKQLEQLTHFENWRIEINQSVHSFARKREWKELFISPSYVLSYSNHAGKK